MSSPPGLTLEGNSASNRPRPSVSRNVLSNWASTGVTIAYSLTITPIVVRALDRELYGIWSFLNGFLAYSNLFYLGLGAALVRYASQYHATRNRTALNRLASVVSSIYTFVGLACVASAVLASPLIAHLMTGSPAPGTAEAAKATVVLLGARVLLMFVGSVFTGILVAEGRYDLYNLVSILGTMTRFVAVPLVVRGSNPLLALALTVVATGAIETLALAGIAFRIDPGLRVRPAIPRSAELRMLYGFGFFAFLMQVSSRIISYSDTTVIGVMLGAPSVALFALPLQLAEYGRIAVYGIVSVLLPHLTRLRSLGHTRELGEVYLRSVRVASFVSAFLNVNLVFLGVPFLRLWVGPAFADAAPVVLTCLALAGFLQSISTQSQTPFCLAYNALLYPVVVLLFEAATNLALSIALARPMGIAGVAVGTVVPALCCSALFIPAYVSRLVGVPLVRVGREALAPALALAGILVVVHLALPLLVRSESYIALAGKAAVTFPVALLTALALFPRGEREVITGSVRKVSARVFSGGTSR